MSARIAARTRYTGVEPDPICARKARPRIEPYGGRLLEMPIEALPPGSKFDLVCAFEVLEHLKDDRAALVAWIGHVQPGGCLLLSVPAFQRQFNAWDALAGHYRRYEPEGMRSLLTGVGLREIEVCAYGFPLGNVLERGRHVAARLSPSRDSMEARTAASGRMPRPPAWMGRAVEFGTRPFRWAERRWPQTARGTGLVALAFRPSRATLDPPDQGGSSAAP